ncbi:MAG: LysR family transcriptional regulator [Acidimicrobiales bacterium]|nr:LysR family transcriptional regulator [Acidimicrobiales bacterium]
MELADVTIAQLRYLLASRDEESWKVAAASCGVSPSAFSQGIAQLERKLDLDLIDRSGRQRSLTAAGYAAATHAELVLAQMRELSRWASEVREGEAGLLVVGMIDTAAVHHFGDALVAFRRRYPEIELRLIVQPSASLTELLLRSEVDLIVAVEVAPMQNVQSVPLVREPMYVYAPPGTDIGAEATWGPWVTFPQASRSRALAGAELQRRGVDFTVVAESSQPAVLREMVQLGMGWTVLSSVDAEREPHALRRAHPNAVTERVLSMSHRSDRTPSPALSRLIDALRVEAS